MSSVNKDTFYTFLVKLPTIVLSFMYTVFITRLLGPEGNGVYTFIMTNANMAVLLLGFNLKTTPTYFIAKNVISFQKIIGIILLLVIIAFAGFGCLMFVLIIFSSTEYLLPTNYDSPFFILFIALTFATLLINIIYESILKGKTYFKIVNIFTLTSNLIAVIIVGGVLLRSALYDLPPLTIQSIFIIVLLIQLGNTLLYTFLFFRKISFKAKFNFSYKKEIKVFFQYAYMGYLIAIANFINKRIDIWFIENYEGVIELGYYALSNNFANFLLLAIAPINHVLLPYLTKMNKMERENTFLFFSRITTWLIVVLSIATYMVVDFVIPLIFGSEFIPSIFPAKILCIGIVFIALRNIFSLYNFACNRLHWNLYANSFGVIITIVLDIILIPKYGIIGAAIASVFAYIGSSIFTIISVFLIFEKGFFKAFVPQKQDVVFLKEKLFLIFKRR